MRLRYQESISNNQHNLIIKSLTTTSSAEAVIAADLYAIKRCDKLGSGVPVISKREITPALPSHSKSVNQIFTCNTPNKKQKRQIAALLEIHCKKKKLHKDIQSLCDNGLPN